MIQEATNPPDYGVIAHNCGDESLYVAGLQNIESGDVRPQSFLDDVKNTPSDYLTTQETQDAIFQQNLLNYINQMAKSKCGN